MNKDRFLTVRWNNLLALTLGIPLVAYAAVVFFTSALSDLAGFIGMAIIAVVY